MYRLMRKFLKLGLLLFGSYAALCLLAYQPPVRRLRASLGFGYPGRKLHSAEWYQNSSMPPIPHTEPRSRGNFVRHLLKIPRQKHVYHIDMPENGSPVPLWPSEQLHRWDDRIINQLMWSPPGSNRVRLQLKEKLILVYTGLDASLLKPGRRSVQDFGCPVTACHLTDDTEKLAKADVVLWQDYLYDINRVLFEPRPPGQIWAVYMLESPFHTPYIHALNGKVNWTSTYRRDSTIVAPYERFTLFNPRLRYLIQPRDYSAGKTKMVAWISSRCRTTNNRLGYVTELQRYIEVDIYGSCGTLKCPRSQPLARCLKGYRFYLAFENSNCRDYITEKFFINGLKHNVIPIVMGAHPEDYRAAAPAYSFIHVDDFDSPYDLAEYLHELASDRMKYNEYFNWKGTGDVINTYFWCRLCSMTHAASLGNVSQVYSDINSWWNDSSTCITPEHSELWPRW